MKKTFFNGLYCPVLLLLAILGLSSCIQWQDQIPVATLPKTCKYNIIGISGPESGEPYVEIQYCKDDGRGKNIIFREMLRPPILFGNHKVNILCDSIINAGGYNRKDRTKYKAMGGYQIIVKHDYGENGAEYLRIVNHSADKTIEFFIAGSQEMETCNSDRSSNMKYIISMPSIYYKKAPIYYLLFPESKYPHNLLGEPSMDNDVFYFEGKRCGDLILDRAWTVNEVMELYRAEFKNDPSIELYIDDSFRKYGRLSAAVHLDSYPMKYKRFYGIIRPGEVLGGAYDIPLLATPSLFDDGITYKQ